MRRLVTDAGLADQIHIESAGTAAYHAGELPDPRSREEAMRRGIRLESRARQFEAGDFRRFDYVLAMDTENLSDLCGLTEDRDAWSRLHLLRSFDPEPSPEREVPDPYYGGVHGFARVFDICESACRGLLAHVVETHTLELPRKS